MDDIRGLIETLRGAVLVAVVMVLSAAALWTVVRVGGMFIGRGR